MTQTIDQTHPAPDIFCKQCYYQINHLKSPQCPECGSPFNPQDPSSFFNAIQLANHKREKWLRWLRIPIFIIITYVALLMLFTAFAELGYPRLPEFKPYEFQGLIAILLQILYFAFFTCLTLLIITAACPSQSRLAPLLIICLFIPLIILLLPAFLHPYLVLSNPRHNLANLLMIIFPPCFLAFKIYQHRTRNLAHTK